MKPKHPSHSAKPQPLPQLFIIRRWQNHPTDRTQFVTEGKG
jgi:hypothetical protein